jgi:phage terminase large subunit
LVYPDFEIIEADFYKDIAKIEVFGLDFGFNDELALIGTKIHDRRLFAHEYIYERGVTPDALIDMLKAKGIRGQMLVCDNSRPEMITHLRAAGFNAVPCIKGAGSVYTGIQLVKSHAISITRSSESLIIETRGYEWITDAGGFATEVPKGKKDHALDALRYGATKQVQMRRGAGGASYVDMSIT